MRIDDVSKSLTHSALLHRETYDAIAGLIDPEIIVAKLRGKYGAELDNPEYYVRDDAPSERRLAHQFAYIHSRVRQQPGTATP